MKFRKKPVVIDALQLLPSTWSEMCEFAGVGPLEGNSPQGCFLDAEGRPLPEGQSSDVIGLMIPTLEGLMIGRQGDWIIRGVKGELYPCKPDIFEATYESVEQPLGLVPAGLTFPEPSAEELESARDRAPDQAP